MPHIIPLGKLVVPVAGTPVSLQTAMTAAGLRFGTYHAAHFQAWHANTGSIYIGTLGLTKASGAKVIHILLAPTDSSIMSFGMALQGAPAGIDIADLYLDADTGGEGVLLTLLEA